MIMAKLSLIEPRIGGPRRRRGNARPHGLVAIGISLAINIDNAAFLVRIVVVRKGRINRGRTEHDIPFLEQRSPLLAQSRALRVGRDPISVGHYRGASS